MIYTSTDQLTTLLEEAIQKLPPTGLWNRLTPVPQACKKRGVQAVLSGEVLIAGEITVNIHIGFQASFPLNLPVIFLNSVKALGRIPHLENDGYICYIKGDGQYINYEDPIAVIESALERAIDTLEKGYRKSNVVDFTDGFAEYWGRLEKVIELRSVIEVGDEAKEIAYAIVPPSDKKAFCYVADDEASLRQFIPQVRKQSFTIQKALYIPLKEGTQLIPPWFDNCWTLSQIIETFEQYTTQATQQFVKKSVRKFKSAELVIFALPRPKGGYALFGLRFTGIRNAHPLTSGSTVRQIIPVDIERLDRAYLTPRSGGLSSLNGKHVALIGCGSVGSYIGLELARAGIGKFTLIDADVLTYENVYRHAVGQYAVGLFKVDALKNDIEKRIPYVDIQAIPKRIETLLTNQKFDPFHYDAIVMATGEPTINLYMNEWLFQKKSSVPVLYTWLEPYGIGGHCLAHIEISKPGCLQCLYQITDDGNIENRASFAAPGQSFLKDIAGCGSLFTPFGSLDVARTAEITSRLLIHSLRGQSDNLLVSWKGNSHAFLSAGYQLTNRYSLEESALEEQKNQFHLNNCPICGQNHE